jgi:hypothetical protein
MKAKKAKKPKKHKVKPRVNTTPLYSLDPSPQITHFLRPIKRFNILPETSFHNLISIYADMLPESFIKRHEYIERHFPMSSPLAGVSPPFFLPTVKIHTGWSKEKSLAIRQASRYIMHHRFAFKKLIHHMRFKRLQRANEDDLVTGEVPRLPVQIVSWNEKRVYTFEAHTLMKDITTRLLNHDGFFEEPQLPRNPFTNIPFTQSQTISVWNSLSRAGIPVSSAFTLYRNSRFNMKKFTEENITLLKLNSLRKTFKEANSYDYKERMIDFIAYCYTIETIDCSLPSFKYAMIHYPNHHLLKKWAVLCEKFYEPEIIYAGNAQQIHNAKELVLDDTYDILHLQREFISLHEIVESVQDDLIRSMNTYVANVNNTLMNTFTDTTQENILTILGTLDFL